MELIYYNMDKLEVTFQGAFSEDLISLLKETKEQAQQQKQPVFIELGKSKDTYKVLSTGLGGFSLGLITADDALQISTQASSNPELWNIFIGVRNWFLAFNGYEAARDRIWQIIDDLGAESIERICPYSGEITTRPLESIRRVDYCFDFYMPDFIPNKDMIIYHQSGKYEEDAFLNENGQGRKINALTIGSRKNRVIQIYNKSEEIKTKGDKFWFDLWGIEKRKTDYIWRVECRLFKPYIRKYNLRTFDDLEMNLSSELRKSFKAIRYLEASSDTNRSRWPNADFWECAYQTAKKALHYKQSGLLPSLVYEARRQRSLESISQMHIGLCISQAVLEGLPFHQTHTIAERVVSDIKALYKDNPELIRQKHDDKNMQYFADQRLN